MGKKIYKKPELKKVENVRDITLECPDFSCSIVVPPYTP